MYLLMYVVWIRLFEIDSTLFQGAKYLHARMRAERRWYDDERWRFALLSLLAKLSLVKFQMKFDWQWQSCFFAVPCWVGKGKGYLCRSHLLLQCHRTRPTGCDSRALLQKTDAPCVSPVHAWTWESWHLCVKKNIYEILWFSWI